MSPRAADPARVRFAIAWLIAIAFGAASFFLAETARRVLPPPRPLEELSYYPSGRYVRPATLGHPEAAADLAWLRAVQYYGEHRLGDNRFERMFHVFDILTSLAPSFEPAYVFGAFALAQEGRSFEKAEALLEKGMAANPRSGALAFQAGFLHYVRPGGRDLKRAAQCFEQAARQPDAPPQAARFAAFARQHAGDLRVAYLLWQQVAETSSNAYLREMAERNMREIREALALRRPELAMRPLATPQVLFVPNSSRNEPGKRTQVPPAPVR